MSSPAAIEKLVQRAGATRFVYDWTPKQAIVGFEIRKRAIRIPVDLPDPNDRTFTRTPARGEERAPAV